MKTARAILLLSGLSALGGCAAKTMYGWNDYPGALYGHYKNPQDRDAWVGNLRSTITTAEAKGEKVPPGIYAEYGHALLEEGQSQEAVTYFRKEQEKWPESRFLMEKLIRNAERSTAQASAEKGPATKAAKGQATKAAKGPAAKGAASKREDAR